jgi:hypothetical protein
VGSPAIVSLWDRLPPSVQAVNPHLRPKAARPPRPSVMAQHAAAGAPEHAAEIVDSHARRDRARATSRTAQAAGGGFEAWCDAQHGAARALGWLVWVDHYGPAVQFLGGSGARVVGKAPPDYLGQLRGGRTLIVEAKRRTHRLAIEGDDREAIRPHQAARLAEAEAGGGLALVLVEFVRAAGAERYAAPWSAVVAAATTPRGAVRRSVGPLELAAWRVQHDCYLAPFVGAAGGVR